MCFGERVDLTAFSQVNSYSLMNKYYLTVNIVCDLVTREATRSDQDQKKPHLWLVVVVVDHSVHKLTPVLTTKPADHY